MVGHEGGEQAASQINHPKPEASIILGIVYFYMQHTNEQLNNLLGY